MRATNKAAEAAVTRGLWQAGFVEEDGSVVTDAKRVRRVMRAVGQHAPVLEEDVESGVWLVPFPRSWSSELLAHGWLEATVHLDDGTKVRVVAEMP